MCQFVELKFPTLKNGVMSLLQIFFRIGTFLLFNKIEKSLRVYLQKREGFVKQFWVVAKNRERIAIQKSIGNKI